MAFFFFKEKFLVFLKKIYKYTITVLMDEVRRLDCVQRGEIIDTRSSRVVACPKYYRVGEIKFIRGRIDHLFLRYSQSWKFFLEVKDFNGIFNYWRSHLFALSEGEGCSEGQKSQCRFELGAYDLNWPSWKLQFIRGERAGC